MKISYFVPMSGRVGRLSALHADSATGPREFFYGAPGLLAAGHEVEFVDSRRDPSGALGRADLLWERVRNRVTEFGISRQRVYAVADALRASDVAVSFTGGFSLSLGLWARAIAPRPGLRIAGGFMGLADVAARAHPPFRGHAHRTIGRALRGLDLVFFLCEADREASMARYDLARERTALFHFGVDDAFWSPSEAARTLPVLAVGSDPNRDYATLLAASEGVPLRIVTRLPVTVPQDRPDVEILRGSFHGSAIDDATLREFYRQAPAVVVPLHDVHQPSGQSVTLQAMACGTPVILSAIRGLWRPDLIRHEENCLLVPPGDPVAIGDALRRLLGDDALRARLGDAGRRTVERHFNLAAMDASIVRIVDRVAASAAMAPPEPDAAALADGRRARRAG